jgi:outer membrane protein TolC
MAAVTPLADKPVAPVDTSVQARSQADTGLAPAIQPSPDEPIRGSLKFDLPPKQVAGPVFVPAPADPLPAPGGQTNSPPELPSPDGTVPEPAPALDSLSPSEAATTPGPVFDEGLLTSPPACDTAADVAPFWHRTLQPHATDVTPCVTIDTPLPAGFTPWWQDHLDQSCRVRSSPFTVDVDALVVAALQHSPYVIAVGTEPQIRQTAICEEVAEFDWRAFVETKYDDLSDPVGNLLTTGGSPRFRDNHFTNNAGVRRRNEIGGEFKVQQRVGYQDTNSRFFVPTQQGTARLELNYTQPLLNRSGRAYNQSRIVLASIDTEIAGKETARQLQDHLLKVTQTYWELYRARCVFLQKQKLLDSAASIEETLIARQEVDVLERQVLRAKAALASRRSGMARADTEIRNAESRLRLLVNSPQMLETSQLELLPADMPPTMHIDLSVTGSLQTALVNRPDIGESIQRVKATGVRLGVARQDLLPKLDLILSTYVAGLMGESDVGQAYVNQFNQGEPGYTVGMLFEMPLGNRAAGARMTRRELEMRKSLAEFRNTVETGLTEVELALREAETSYQEMLSRYQSMLAAERESLYLLERWKVLPDADRSSVLLLEDLLDAQERLANEEAAFVTSQTTYVLALADLKRVMGVLISTQIITPSAFVAAEGDSDEAGVDEEVVRPAQRDADETENAVDAESLTPPVGRREATEAARDAESSTPEVQRTSGTGPQMNRNPHSNRRMLTDVPEAAPGKTSRRSQKSP